MRVRNKRVLKNGVLAGYVLQKDGTWKFRFLKGKRKKQRGGNALDWRLTQKDKTLIRNNLKKINNVSVFNLRKEKKQNELRKDMNFLQQLNIFAVLNFIASNNDLRELIRNIFKKGFGVVGNQIKNRLIVTIEEKIKQNSHLIMASHFFIKGFGEKVNTKNVGKQIIDLIVSKKSYKSRENTEDFKKIRNKNKKIGGPAHIFTNVGNVNNNLPTQPSRNKNNATRQIQRLYRGKKGRNTARNLKRKNTATRQIQRLYRGKKGRNTARNLKEKNTVNTVRTNNIGNEPSFQNRNFQLREYNRMKEKLEKSGMTNFSNNSINERIGELSEQKQRINEEKNNPELSFANQNTLENLMRLIDNEIRGLEYFKQKSNLKRKNNATKKIQSAFRGKKGRNRARNEQRARNKKKNKEALELQIELLIELLKKKGKKGILNSQFGKKGYKYFAQELEKYKNYLNSNKKNNKLPNLLKILGEIKLRVEKPKNPRKNIKLRNSIKKLENKIQKNITIYERNFS
jgi:hypothetical protein